MIEGRVRTGLERFYQRYPEYPRQQEEVKREYEFEYLGIGAMMIDPTILMGGNNGNKINNLHKN